MSKKIITTQEGLEQEIKRMKKKKDKDHNSKTKLNAFYGVLFALLIVYVICLLMPLVWSFITSFRKEFDFLASPLFPKSFNELTFNYGTVFSLFNIEQTVASVGKVKVGMIQMYVNSILYSVGGAFVAILVPCLTAYLCSKFNYMFNKVLVSIVIVTMSIPIVGSLPAALKMSENLGFKDHIWGMWIQSGSFLGTNFLIFTAMWNGVPKDFTEAARVDGAGNFRILLQIMLPLAKNTFLTLMILAFIGSWNDYMTPLLYLPSYPTAAYGLWYMHNGVTIVVENFNPQSIPAKMAASIMLLLPMLILFCIFQKRLVGNLSMGGVKG